MLTGSQGQSIRLLSGGFRVYKGLRYFGLRVLGLGVKWLGFRAWGLDSS